MAEGKGVINNVLDQAHFIGAPNVRGEFPVLDIDHEFLFNVDLETAVLLTRTQNITDKTSLVDLCPPPIAIYPQTMGLKDVINRVFLCRHQNGRRLYSGLDQ